MGIEEQSLRDTLASGASRIFNVAEITRRLDDAEGGGSGPYLFKHRSLNDGVFIKRPKDAAPPTRGGPGLGGSAEILENGELKTITFDMTARVEKGDIATFLC
jgi:hypothetical protein